jgi:hypothetical protein
MNCATLPTCVCRPHRVLLQLSARGNRNFLQHTSKLHCTSTLKQPIKSRLFSPVRLTVAQCLASFQITRASEQPLVVFGYFVTLELLYSGLAFQNALVAIQNVPGGKGNILEGHRIGHSKQKIVYVRVSYSERFPK